MDETYLLYPYKNGRWAIRRQVGDRWVVLVQNSYLDAPGDAAATLQALGIEPSKENLDRYFPIRGKQGRCPTLELLELTNALDPTNPVARKKQGETGV